MEQIQSKERHIHTFSYLNHHIDVVYTPELIEPWLKEATGLLSVLLKEMQNGTIKISKKHRLRLAALDSICSCYIEGYRDSTYTPVTLAKANGSLHNKSDRAILACYQAYLEHFGEQHSTGVFSMDDMIESWKTVMGYRPFLRKRIRVLGVRVGTLYKTVHVAPPSFEIRGLMREVFQSLLDFKTLSTDEFGLIRPIILHYLYTFIHPFIDGNGRTARLFEIANIADFNSSKGLNFVLPISNVIKYSRYEYFSSFQAGKQFKHGNRGLVKADITEFINYNLYAIAESVIAVYSEFRGNLCRDFVLPESAQDNLKMSTKDYISTFGYTSYIEGLLSTKLAHLSYGTDTLRVSNLYSSDSRLNLS